MYASLIIASRGLLTSLLVTLEMVAALGEFSPIAKKLFWFCSCSFVKFWYCLTPKLCLEELAMLLKVWDVSLFRKELN